MTRAEKSSQPSSLLNLTENFDNFLKLLTKQLENQNPLSPMSNTEFTQQLVGFAQAEQAIKANAQLENLVKLYKSQQMSSTLNLLGKRVQVLSNLKTFIREPVDFTYQVPENLRSMELLILNQNRQVVRAAKLPDGKKGIDHLRWDGTDTEGRTLPSGPYELVIRGYNRDGQVRAIKPAVTGTISEISALEDGTFVTIDGRQFAIEEIQQVQNPIEHKQAN